MYILYISLGHHDQHLYLPLYCEFPEGRNCIFIIPLCPAPHSFLSGIPEMDNAKFAMEDIFKNIIEEMNHTYSLQANAN